MAELPALYREALTLRFEEGMKLEEIAEVTRTPLSTVKSRVRRGLEAMKQRLCKEDIVMSDHESVRELLALSAAGLLDPGEERLVREHVRQCAACAAELDDYAALSAGLSALPAPQPPADLVSRTTALCRRRSRTAARAPSWPAGPRFLPVSSSC